jgi:hypothetical protein
MSAGVITANIIWKATKASAGTVPCTSEASPERPAYDRSPMTPCHVGPNASE